MPSPIDSMSFVRLLDTRLRKVSEGEYDDLPGMIERIFNILPSDSAWEEFYGVGDVGDFDEFVGSLTYKGIAPGYYTRIEPKEYALGMKIERKLIDDKKYAVLDNMAAKIGASAKRTREKRGVRAFNLAFSTAFDYMVSEEGVALCSSSHTTKAGTSTSSGFDNSGTTAFDKTAVAATRLLMRKFKNDISERIDMGDDLALIVPDELADDAYEVVRTPQKLDSADHNVNMDYGRYEVIPYMRLDDNDTNNWFMVWKSNMKENLHFIDRIKPEFKMMVDFNTFQFMYSGYMRLGYGFTNWRWIYGHNVS